MSKDYLIAAVLLVALIIVNSVGYMFVPGLISLVDLFFLATFVLAMHRSALLAELFGMIGGLFLDVMSGSIIGMHAISLLVIGYLFSTVRTAVVIRRFSHQVATLFVALLLHLGLQELIYYTFGLGHSLDVVRTIVYIVVTFTAGTVLLKLLVRFAREEISTIQYEKH